MQILEASKHIYPEVGSVSPWYLFLVDRPNAKEQMSFDEELAKEAHPALRFFRWATPALSLGFKQVLPSWIDEMVLGRFGIELVRRPTGGGIAVHGSDISFSAVVPHLLGLNMRDVMDMSCRSLVKGLGSRAASRKFQ
jgi:lipoate-protein ligase A